MEQRDDAKVGVENPDGGDPPHQLRPLLGALTCAAPLNKLHDSLGMSLPGGCYNT